MNDERSLIKQIKWLKQELNNLKIANQKGAGEITFFSQEIKIPDNDGATWWTVTARRVDEGTGDFFGSIIEVGENVSAYQIDNFARSDVGGSWKIYDYGAEGERILLLNSTSPCTVTVERGR